MASKIEAITTAKLQEMARTLVDDFSSEASIVLDHILAALEQRMDEVSFVALCEQLA